MTDDLSIKEQIFVHEFLIDGNGTRAATAAGWGAKSARVAAYRLRKKPRIQAALAKEIAMTLDKLEVTRERVLAEIAKLAFLDPRKFFNSDGSVKQPSELDDDTAAALSGLEVTELFEGSGQEKQASGLLKKIKISDKRAALELLGRHLKMFTDKVQHENPDGTALAPPVVNVMFVKGEEEE